MQNNQILFRHILIVCLSYFLFTSCTAKKIAATQNEPQPTEVKVNTTPVKKEMERAPMEKKVAINAAPPTVAPPPPPPPPDEEIFVVVEDMPRFPGCETSISKSDKQKCSDQKLLEFVQNNLQYPEIAKENGVEGICVIRFTILENGTVSDIRLLRDIGAGCGEESVRIMNVMKEQGIVWTPGKQRGRPVKVSYNMPIKFQLPEKE